MSNLPFHECNVESFEDALMALDGSAIEQFDCDGFLDLLDGADGDDDDAPAIEPIQVTSGGRISTNDTVEPPVEVTSAQVAAPKKSKRNRKRPSMRSARSLSPPRKRSSVKDIRGVDFSGPEMFSDSCPEIFSEPNVVSPPPVSSSTPPPEGPRDEHSSANVNQAEFERMMNKLALSMQRSELSRRNLTGNLPVVQQRPQQRQQQQRQQRANSPKITTAESSQRRCCVATPPAAACTPPAPSAERRATPQFQTLAGLSGFLDGTRPTLTAALEQSRRQLKAYGRVSIGGTL